MKMKPWMTWMMAMIAMIATAERQWWDVGEAEELEEALAGVEAEHMSRAFSR